jgi:hypothetical protein
MLPFQLLAIKTVSNCGSTEPLAVQSYVRVMAKNVERPIAGWWLRKGKTC